MGDYAVATADQPGRRPTAEPMKSRPRGRRLGATCAGAGAPRDVCRRPVLVRRVLEVIATIQDDPARFETTSQYWISGSFWGPFPQYAPSAIFRKYMQGFRHAGGGTRTPDTRIMIPPTAALRWVWRRWWWEHRALTRPSSRGCRACRRHKARSRLRASPPARLLAPNYPAWQEATVGPLNGGSGSTSSAVSHVGPPGADGLRLFDEQGGGVVVAC
jgi:hypothetical protein